MIGRSSFAVTLLLVVAAAGCSGYEAEVEEPRGGEPGAPATATPEPLALQTVGSDTVRGWTGPGGQPFEVTLRTPGRATHLTARIGQRDFALPARVTNRTLVQYPCTSCHEGVVALEDRVVDAHRNIQPTHPARTGATCATCHAADSVHRLVLPGGETASMDHTYQLCAQCHSPQLTDWAAGSHGKRLSGWSGRRIVMNCGDCHDPHRPSIQPRTPFPGPILPTGDGEH